MDLKKQPSGAAEARKKRDLSDRESSPLPKKLAPIFHQGKPAFQFHWLEPIAGSCLHGVYGDPIPSSKIAAFDLDGTIIKVKSGKKFPKTADDWILWSSSVPKKLQEIHSQGYVIVLLSNQNFTSPQFRANFEKKLIQITRSFSVPMRLFAAREKDKFRKPLTGMWDEFVTNYNGGLEPNLSDSFFVGDAAGRPAMGSSPKDWNDTDRKLALNLGVSFFTPEEWFGDEPKRTDFVLSGFDPHKHDHSQPVWHPPTTPLALPLTSPCEILLFVGPPSVGKTTFFEKYFYPFGYQHVNQDTLKTFDKCLTAVKQCIISGKSCIVDNTNPSRKTRSAYISCARDLACGIRCVFFTAPIALAQHNNVYRACIQGTRPLLPTLAFASYEKNLEEPSIDEGFDELKKVHFVFEGTSEEKVAWEKYLL